MLTGKIDRETVKSVLAAVRLPSGAPAGYSEGWQEGVKAALAVLSGDTEYPAVAMDAIRYLAGVCDGAVALDNQGFNGADTEAGHALAEQSTRGWTDRQLGLARRFITRYRRQLQSAGYA